MREFFSNSDCFDYEVLRPLSHILSNWELTWDHAAEEYCYEADSFVDVVNAVILELDSVTPPAQYHDHEDRLAEYVQTHLNWPIRKQGNRWVGADYERILEQGGFHDIDEKDLILAAAGRIRAAIDRGQTHFDDMEESHRRMLGSVLSVIVYHRVT